MERENIKMAGQIGLGVDIGEVEEVTDSCEKELTDKEIINLEEIKVSV
jgi:hypothetical protein